MQKGELPRLKCFAHNRTVYNIYVLKHKIKTINRICCLW